MLLDNGEMRKQLNAYTEGIDASYRYREIAELMRINSRDHMDK